MADAQKPAGADDADRISQIDIERDGIVRYSPKIEAERRTAVNDLIAQSCFRLVGEGQEPGPYHVRLRRREDRLVFDVRNGDDEAGATRINMNLTPLRRTIHDYFSVCESYFDASSFARPGRLEVIDAGRKALHNEGANALRERLAGKIELDHETARRLFTLICVLQIRS